MDERRFAVVVAGWTFLTAVCTITLGVLGLAVWHIAAVPSFEESGPGGLLALPLSWGFIGLGVAAVFVVPLGIAGYRYRTGAYDGLGAVAWSVGALALFPIAPMAWHSTDVDTVGVVGIVLVGLAALAVALVRTEAAVGASVRRHAPAQFVHVGLGLVLVTGFAVGVAAGPPMYDATVATDEVGNPVPFVDFQANYTATSEDRGVATITHGGGDDVPVDRVIVDGTGFADVSGANQTAPGPWQGSAGGPNGTITAGDSVSVGVEGDCTVWMVYVDDEGARHTFGVAECEELR